MSTGTELGVDLSFLIRPRQWYLSTSHFYTLYRVYIHEDRKHVVRNLSHVTTHLTDLEVKKEELDISFSLFLLFFITRCLNGEARGQY
ncbi:hypothetical protein RRG08_019936 [Elysia crispata]|uniref:Uncharacterized protein n=1 Tax=Elysia crispata TaxID=231223 RepID=A0AAE0ZVX1_9GAST|nr:hypothetical protein RRG08_000370 [Elysia crispata]KAK3779214.1 hypothetical protein RRG08_019936 [Elysia crispata]